MNCNVCFKEFSKKNKDFECKSCKRAVCKSCLRTASLLSNNKVKNEVCLLCFNEIDNAQNKKRSDWEKKALADSEKLDKIINQKTSDFVNAPGSIFNTSGSSGANSLSFSSVGNQRRSKVDLDAYDNEEEDNHNYGSPSTINPRTIQNHRHQQALPISSSRERRSPSHTDEEHRNESPYYTPSSSPFQVPPRRSKVKAKNHDESNPPTYDRSHLNNDSYNNSDNHNNDINHNNKNSNNNTPNDNKNNDNNKNNDDEDERDDFLSRLKNLKKDPKEDDKDEQPKPPATMDDLAARLALLTGRPPANQAPTNSHFLEEDTRTEDEKINDIIGQVQTECRLEQKYPENPNEFIDRLSSLKEHARNLPNRESTDELNEDNITGSPPKMHAEDFMPPPMVKYNDDDEDFEEEEDEFPWCCLCNDDAYLRCEDCDDELFCRPCFKTTHKDRDMKKHSATKYVKPKNSKYT